MRRGTAGALGVSLGVHAAAFAALALAPQTQPQHAAAGAGLGTDLVFVDLLRLEGGSRPRADRAPALEGARSRDPRAANAHPPGVPEPAAPSGDQGARAPRRRPQPIAAQPPDRRAPAPRSAPFVGAEPPLASVSGVEREPTSRGRAHAGDAPIRGEPAGAAPHASALASAQLSRVARPASEIRPLYPDSARERGDEAEVIVEAWVSASGRVEEARVRGSAGNAFDSAALDAVRRARFHPASRDGEPVASRVAMRLHFTLER